MITVLSCAVSNRQNNKKASQSGIVTLDTLDAGHYDGLYIFELYDVDPDSVIYLYDRQRKREDIYQVGNMFLHPYVSFEGYGGTSGFDMHCFISGQDTMRIRYGFNLGLNVYFKIKFEKGYYVTDPLRVPEVEINNDFHLGKSIIKNKQLVSCFVENVTNRTEVQSFYPGIRTDSNLGDLSFQVIDLNVKQSLLLSEPAY